MLIGASSETCKAYVEIPYALGRIISESTNIVVMQVERVDREKNLIIYRKVRDLKGTCATEQIKHNIGKGGFAPREWQNVMNWAEIGQTALFFYAGGAGETCIENYWYQMANAGEWWTLNHAEPYLLRSFAGKPDKLATAVAAILAGQEVPVPCMVDGDKNALQLRNARLQRLKASLKLMEYDPKRDFAGWGVEELRAIEGMPGFMQYGPLARIDGGARGVAAADFEGNGKPGLCLFGGGRVVLMKNALTSFNDVPLGIDGGASAAAWGDFNGDGRPDLLVATPAGPRLFVNQKGESFKDETSRLPKADFCNLKAAAWIDNGDGKLDVLLADGFRGLRLYRNLGGPPLPGTKAFSYGSGPWFEDVSDKVGLGERGVAAGMKGDHLAVADVNGDGRMDFLYSAGTGVLAVNTPQGFVAAKDCGINYTAGGVTPVFGDFLGDKRAGLFVPQNGQCKLYRNDGQGRFADITAQSGALAAPMGRATCAAWTDFFNTGKLDLVVGCLKGPNRLFRNGGNGVFTDATDQVGLSRRIFNTRGLAVLDLNKDGVADVVMVNEGQDSAVLLGDPARGGK
ncbi:MAG: FG-GAP repeat domain-containing protein [Phycisphaerae bacterium]